MGKHYLCKEKKLKNVRNKAFKNLKNVRNKAFKNLKNVKF